MKDTNDASLSCFQPFVSFVQQTCFGIESDSALGA